MSAGPSSFRVRFLAGIRVAHDLPGIARHIFSVDENHADCAFARGFFVFVSPAAVVGERFAFEKFRIVGGRLVHQHEQHFAVNVDALVVVPAIFGGFDAVADVDDIGIDVGLRLLGLIVGDIFIKRLQIHGLAMLRQEYKLRLQAGW